MLDQLRQIAIFAKTVDHGSFRAAARALDISPSVVSHHVTQLEERLGTALLYRSTRKLSVTEDGKRLLSNAHVMIDAAEAGLTAIADRGRALSGVLHVTVPAVLARSALVDRIAGFSRDHPNVHLMLDFSDARREVIGGGIDVAIRMGWLSDSSLKARRLHMERRVLVASPDFLHDRALPHAPGDVEDWAWLELSPVRLKPRFAKPGQAAVRLKPQSRISANDAHAVYRLAQAGAGLAIVPEFLAAPDIGAGAMIHVLPDWELDPIGVYAVWPPNAPRQGLTARFIEVLVAKGGPAAQAAAAL